MSRGTRGRETARPSSPRASFAMGDEAAQLAEAAKLSWEDRFAHKFWKARVAAYEGVVKEASISETIADSPCLRAFGA